MRKVLVALCLALAVFAARADAGVFGLFVDIDHLPPTPTFTRQIREVDFAGTAYTPWDIDQPLSLLTPQKRRDYTVMIYMIGSDLESLEGAATLDIEEMLGSGLDAEKINVILLTGGTNRWQNNQIPENTCALWRVENGELVELGDIGLRNMGDAGTLASFIRYSMTGFPAERNALVFWDHAGGSIAGYGHDEKFDGSLSLLEMNYAFERAGLRENRLDLIGFDACLMASVEMAVIASPYADFLVASQDLEPGDGWDYGFLQTLSENPTMAGDALGKLIADTFIKFYGPRSRETLTLSVTDLRRAEDVMAAMDGLMAVCSHDLIRDRAGMFAELAGRRGRTKTFGEGSPRDNSCDMVDLRDMAVKLSDIYPGEAAALLGALDRAVIYNRHNQSRPLGGLTGYYIFGGKETAARSLEIYAGLGMSESYTQYLRSFADILTGEAPAAGGDLLDRPDCEANVQLHLTLWREADDDGEYAMVGITGAEGADFTPPRGALWPSIGGEFVGLYEIEHSAEKSLYAIPANHNGREVNLIALISPEYPRGKILGARQREGFIIQKGYDDIDPGDTLFFYHRVRRFGAGGQSHQQWRETPAQTVAGQVTLDWSGLPMAEGYYYAHQLTDLKQNERFTELIAA
ncbi:MAG: clostripain-related cysteine peptidase [Oscillospiraceae bacterium]|nr:clostripain-related cysteine peptidase [Oscillospiraceae bacterium]